MHLSYIYCVWCRKSRSMGAQYGILERCRGGKDNERGGGEFSFSKAEHEDQRRAAHLVDRGRPYCSSIGFLTFEQADGYNTAVATGTLILENLVLTVAHAFFRRDDMYKKTHRCIPKQFHFQLNGKYEESSTYEVEGYRVNEEFEDTMVGCQGDNYQLLTEKIQNDLIAFDYALIRLKRPVYNAPIPKIILNLCLEDLEASPSVFVFGYPTEYLIKEESQNVGAKMWGHMKNIKSIDNGYITHNVPTSQGQSGSPIFLCTKNLGEKEKDSFYLVGMHTGVFKKDKNLKYGAPASTFMIESLKKWQQEMHLGKQSNRLKTYEIRQKKIVPTAEYVLGQKIEQRTIISAEDLGRPYCCIGFLSFDSTSIATGTLIMDSLVLTAAHTFFDRDDVSKRVHRRIPRKFRFQLQGKFEENSTYEVESFRVNEVFENLMERCQGEHYDKLDKEFAWDLISNDYALIKLNRPVSNAAFPKLLKNYRLGDLPPHINQILLYGYDAENVIRDHKHDIEGAKIVADRGKLIRTIDNYYNHNLVTSQEQSGSSAFLRTKNVAGVQGFFLVGIHTGYFFKEKYNNGPLVSETMVTRLKEWQKKLLPQKDRNYFNICEVKDRRIVEVEAYRKKPEPKPQVVPLPQADPWVKEVDAQAIPFDGYRPFKFTFDTRTQQSQQYSVASVASGKKVRRKRNLPNYQNQPFHLISKEAVPSGKWKISIRVHSYSKDEFIIVGFINQFLKVEQTFSGLPDQKQCVSLCLCEKSTEKEIDGKGSLLVDGVLWRRHEDVFVKREEILTIYTDVAKRKLYWAFESGNVVECRIPESIFADEAQMLFFVGLNNKQEMIQILN